MAEGLLSEKMCFCTLLLALLEKYMCIFCFASGVVLENYLSVLYHHTRGVGLSSQMVIIVAIVIFRLDVSPIYFVKKFIKYHISANEPEESLILEPTLKFKSFKKQ